MSRVLGARHVRIHTWRAPSTALAGLAFVFATAVGTAVACTTTPSAYAPLDRPDRMDDAVVTNDAPDLSSVRLPAVAGTSTTLVPVGPGPFVLEGRVEGPAGPAAGATVRLQRLVGKASGFVDVVTGPDGSWRAPEMLGGQYRVRAWRPPDLVGRRAAVLFVTSGQAALVLRVEQVPDSQVVAVPMPAPPVAGEVVELAVHVVGGVIGPDGTVNQRAQAGVRVSLTAPGWDVRTPASVVTDASGRAAWLAACRPAGPTQVVATVFGQTSVALDLPACSEPPSLEAEQDPDEAGAAR